MERLRKKTCLEQKIDRMNYEVNTAEKRKKTQVCHVNGKKYVDSQSQPNDKERKWRKLER